jgi:hypothetical protein
MAMISSGPIECDRRGRSYSLRGREAERLGDLWLGRLSAVGS